MRECVHEQMEEYVNGCVHEQMEEYMDEWKYVNG